MKEAIHFRGIGAVLELKGVGLKGPSQLRAQRLFRQGKRVSVPTSGELKPHKSHNSPVSEAIRLAQHGDPGAFEIIYQEHSRRVYALCLRMLGDPTEAEDLVQDVFVLLFRKIHTFRGESAFSTWLHRLVGNLGLRRLLKNAPPMGSLEVATYPNRGTTSRTSDLCAADLMLEGSVDRVNLERCIERLPAGYRAIFILHDVQGF